MEDLGRIFARRIPLFFILNKISCATQNILRGGAMRKRFVKIVVVLGLFFCLIMTTNVNYSEIYSLPENFLTNYSEIKDINQNKKFGSIINSSIQSKIKDTATGEKEDVIIFKAFGFIPIRKVKVKLIGDDDLYLGGIPIGVAIKSKGLIVEETNDIFKKGDIITEIDGNSISKLSDLSEIEEGEVKFLRQNKEHRAIVKNFDKLNLATTSDVSGIGTLTYINPKDNGFGALGHAITEDKNMIEVEKGGIYPCNLLGIEKGKRNDPGQLKCIFLQNKGSKGDILLNNKYGIFGKINDRKDLVDENQIAKIGGRLSVTPGKAKIVSCVSGIREEYDIEIIKAKNQIKSKDKSLVFRVTDEKLLGLAGGIVQGMSGSPIVQNGKIVGAVTHVFTSDPTKGYGVYIDWMLQEGA